MSDIEYVMVMHDGSKATKFMSEDYCKDLMEQLAFAQSPEVCTVAHDNVETCGYCQRDALAARLAEAERLLFALRDGIAVADFGDWNLLDQVDSFRSGDSTASSASGGE